MPDVLTHQRIIDGIENSKKRVYLVIDKNHEELWKLDEVQMALESLSDKEYSVKIFTNKSDILPESIRNNGNNINLAVAEDREIFVRRSGYPCIFDNNVLYIYNFSKLGYDEPAHHYLKYVRGKAKDIEKKAFSF
jgi:hypothetical protein